MKHLSICTHVCECGCILDREHNAAKNILSPRLSTVGHTPTWGEALHACGDFTATDVEAIRL